MADTDAGAADERLALGAWGRADGFTGLVAAINDAEITLFQPGTRQLHRSTRSNVRPVPAGAVTVTVTVDLPLAHGLGEDEVRRWLAMLTDPVLRDRARQALREAHLDDAAAQPAAQLDVRPAPTSGAVCLCGARTPTTPGTAVGCAACGRHAVGSATAPQ